MIIKDYNMPQWLVVILCYYNRPVCSVLARMPFIFIYTHHTNTQTYLSKPLYESSSHSYWYLKISALFRQLLRKY